MVGVVATLWIVVSLHADGALAAPHVQSCEVSGSGEAAVSRDTVGQLTDFFQGLFGLPASETTSNNQDTPLDLYFTKASNFSSRPYCSSAPGAAPSRRDHIYYPIGIVVRKIGEAELGKRTFALVETEYGLRTFIRREDLEPLQTDKVYLFSKGANVKKGYCPGRKGDGCDPADYVDGRHLDPQTRYAVAEPSAIDPSPNHNYILDTADLGCGPVEVGIWSRSGYQEDGVLNTCVDRGTTTGVAVPSADGTRIFDPAIKLVRFVDYQAYFAKEIDAAVLQIESGFLQTVAPEYATQKRCNTTLTFQSDSDYELKAGGTLKFLAVLEMGGEVAKRYLRRFNDTIGPDVAVHLHGYRLGTEAFDGASVAPVQVYYGCDRVHDAPQTANEIRISSFAADFVIGVRSGEAENDTKNLIDVVSTGQSGLFEQGFVFYVKGYRDYFSKRDEIEGLLKLQYRERMQDFFLDPDDDLYYNRIADFLSHLVIATTGKPVVSR